jgi:hypothetical protein
MAYCHFTEGELWQLHRRFGHPAAERLHKVLARAGYDDINESVVAKINKYRHLCQLHGGAPGRFRFMIRDDVEFNYKLIVDVIYINGKPVLHAINEAIAFQAAKFLQNLQAKTIWNTLRAIWINTYVGPSDVIATNVGTNFVTAKFVNNAKIIAIEVEKVFIEAHNSINKIERYHAPIRRTFEVITADLGKEVSAENAL